MNITFWLVAFLGLSLGFGCAKEDPKSANTTHVGTHSTPAPVTTASIPRDGKYDGKGVVINVDMKLGSVEIDHEPMPEVMPQAMTMIYYVSDPGLLGGLKAGDKIDFVLEYKHPTETIVSIKKVK